MTHPTYTYNIVNVDEAARCMEVVYASEGRQTMHISARLPYEGESLESIVSMYSPVAYWQEQEAQIAAPTVGVSGVITPPSMEVDAENVANMQMWEQLAFERRVAAALVKFGILTSDPTEVPVAQL